MGNKNVQKAYEDSVNERKALEHEIEENLREQKRMQALLDAVPAGVGIYEVIEGKVVQNYMNDAFYQMLGTTRENRSRYFGNNTLSAAHPDDVISIQSALKKLQDGSDKAEATYRILLENDTWFWVHLIGTVVERRDNYIKLYANLSDYNETMRVQNELEYSKITMKAALSAAKILTWRYDYKTSCVTDSFTLGEAYHLPKVVENVPQTIIDMGFIAEESIPGFRKMFERVAEEKTVIVETKANAQNENGYKWYRQIYTPVFDDAGNYIDAIAIAIDITDQKERESSYEEQSCLLRVAAQGALAFASYNLTANVVTECESKNLELQGIMKNGTADDVLHCIRNIVCNVMEQEAFAHLQNVKTAMAAYRKGVSHIEFRHRLKDQRGWVQTTFDMIENPRTGDIEAIGFMRDITDAVRSELVVDQLVTIDYQSIFIIDTNTGESFPFQQSKKDGLLAAIIKMQKEKGDNQEGLKAFLRKYAVTGTAEKAIKENSPEYINRRLESAPYYESVYALILDGRRHVYRTLYAYLQQSKDIMLCAVRDVTEIYEQEEEQKTKLSLALEEARAANEAKTAFLSRVSHDMRTPLNGILGLTALLKDSVTDDRFSRDLTELEMSGKYLLNLINDTLDMSRIESGKMELHPSVCDGKTLFNNALGLAKTSIQEKNIDFHVHAEELPFTTLYVDVERIEQVVLNVLGNAVKFTPPGGRIDVTMTNLAIEDGVITDKLVVQDSGIGISEKFLPRIFEAFSQEDASRTSSYQGTGLGMAITKQLVRLMDGDISVESEPGKGSCFTIVLKLHIATDEQIAEWKKKQVRYDDRIDMHGKRVLLCEDHPLNAKIATRLLEARGMLVEHAENGKTGVQMFEHSPSNYYSAILMDIRMPVMDGLDAARTIRALPRRDARLVPIIAMTANAFEDDVQQTKNAGMDVHLSKPIQADVLYQTLGELLKIDPDMKKKSILIVDDMEVNRAVIRVSLEDDYDIIEAENGKQAMEIMENRRGLDAVITDIQMPEMDGIELIRRIRSNNAYRHVVIIANTQFGDPEQEEQLLQLGANDFVYKPTTPKIVEIRVRNAMRRL